MEVGTSTGTCFSAVGASFTGACEGRNFGILLGEFFSVDGLEGSWGMKCAIYVAC